MDLDKVTVTQIQALTSDHDMSYNESDYIPYLSSLLQVILLSSLCLQNNSKFNEYLKSLHKRSKNAIPGVY